MYDIIIIGSGPGGYAGAVRASQLGRKVAIVERAELGGVCLNWGCIPTKALLKSAQVYKYTMDAAQYGVEVSGASPNLSAMVERSRGVAGLMSKGIEHLVSKHNIDVIPGSGRILERGKVEVGGTVYECQDIVIATGARPRVLPAIPVDHTRIITSREAMTLGELPGSMVVVGSGAIGLEFATFYSALGVDVTIVEYLDRIAPLEDADISAVLQRTLRKSKIGVLTSTEVLGVVNNGPNCTVTIKDKRGEEKTLEADIVLSAVGVQANIEDLGLESVGVECERGRIKVEPGTYQTTAAGIYAIGDVIDTPALAHIATSEAIACVEGICGETPAGVNYGAIPSCVYTFCEVASVGMTESAAVEAGFEVLVGKFSFMASGKAAAAGSRDGMIKLVFDKRNERLLGAHLAGLNVTEMLAGLTYMLQCGTTARDIIECVHPHPTISECVMEAAANALGVAIHG